MEPTTKNPFLGLKKSAEPDPSELSQDPADHKVHPGTLMFRMKAACICGWHPDNHPGQFVADHLREFGALS